MFPELTESQIQCVVEKVKEFVKVILRVTKLVVSVHSILKTYTIFHGQKLQDKATWIVLMYHTVPEGCKKTILSPDEIPP